MLALNKSDLTTLAHSRSSPAVTHRAVLRPSPWLFQGDSGRFPAQAQATDLPFTKRKPLTPKETTHHG